MDLSKFINQSDLDNLIVKVYIYDNELKCVINKDKYDLVKFKDLKDYINLNKERLYDSQEFVKSNL